MKSSFLKYLFFPVLFLLVFQGEGRGEVFSGFGKEVGEETAACVKEHSNEDLFLLIKNADNDAARIRYSHAWNYLDLAESSSKLDPTVLTKLGDDLLDANFATYLEGGVGRVKAWEALDDLGVEQAIRRNNIHLENIDGYFTTFGRNSNDLATTANQFDNVEDYLNVLPDIVNNSLVRGTRFDDFVSVSGFGNNFHHAEYSYHLWKSENWSELENLFNSNSINGGWPPNRGFVSSLVEPLPINYQFDRYGSNGGNFVSPDGTPFGSRALPVSYETSQPYNRYKVLRNIPSVKTGPAIPWFGQQGLGIQLELPLSIDELLNAVPPYIEKIN